MEVFADRNAVTAVHDRQDQVFIVPCDCNVCGGNVVRESQDIRVGRIVAVSDRVVARSPAEEVGVVAVGSNGFVVSLLPGGVVPVDICGADEEVVPGPAVHGVVSVAANDGVVAAES